MQHRLSFRICTSHLLDFFGGHPVAQVEGIIGADHDVIRADHALQILDRLNAIDKIVEIEIIQIFARRLLSGHPRGTTATAEAVVEPSEMIRKKAAAVEQSKLQVRKAIEDTTINHVADRERR